jgi:hypothetical protein
MVNVLVNGAPFSIDSRNVRTIGELVELVKATIDPDTIITSLSISGRQPSETDWRVPLVAHGGTTVEVSTGTKEEYLIERLALVEPYLESIEGQVTQARLHFRNQDLKAGNEFLAGGMKNLRAFIEWYGTLLELAPVSRVEERQNLIRQAQGLIQTCEQLLQQELRQMWSLLALTLESRLEPQLAEFRQSCTIFRQADARA